MIWFVFARSKHLLEAEQGRLYRPAARVRRKTAEVAAMMKEPQHHWSFMFAK